jgi:hypothetical protein
MKIADIRKIDRSKLPNEDFKSLYDVLKKDSGDFDPDFIELYDEYIMSFLTQVKKYVPEAITEKVVKQRQPRKQAEKPIDFEDDDVVETVMEDYNLTREKAVKLIALRKEAYELKKENFEKLIKRLDKSEFYQGKNSNASIDKGRTRDLAKDSKQSAITLSEELKMTGRPFKRISKAGRKNQYGTTKGGKVYYEYRMNRRDVDKKIKLEQGGGINSFDYGDNVIIVFNKQVNLVLKTKFREETITFKKNENIEVEIDDFKGEKIDVIFVNDQREKATINKKDIFSLTPVFKESSKYVKPKFLTDEKLIYKPYKKGGGVDIPNSDKMFHLPYEIVVYVPSTKDVDKIITATELRARVKEVEKYLAETFGGFTSAEKVGGYLSSKSSVITEKVIPVTSFASMQSFKENKSKLVNKMSVWAKKWGQEAIGFEFEGDLYYVPQKFNKGGKLTATYIPNRDIKSLTTVWGNNIKGKDLIDGAYTTRKDIKTPPKMVRSMFEEEEFSEFLTGGVIAYSNDDYEQKVGNFSSLAEAKKFAIANRLKYATITFEDEYGDNIVVTNEDTLKDIDWLFSEEFKKGGKTKPKEPVMVRGFADDEPYEYAKGGNLAREMHITNTEPPIPIYVYTDNVRYELHKEYKDKIWSDKYSDEEKKEYFNNALTFSLNGKKYYGIGYKHKGKGNAVNLFQARRLKKLLEANGYKVIIAQSIFKFDPEKKVETVFADDVYDVYVDKILPLSDFKKIPSTYGLINF